MGVGASGGIRTRTVFLLREAPPASWATDAKMVLPAVSNLPPRLTKAVTCLMIERSELEPAASNRTCISPGTNRRLCQLSYAGSARRACPVRAFEIARAGLARFAPSKLVLAAG